MKVEFHTGEEEPTLLFEGNSAEVAVPLIGDFVLWAHTDWYVKERKWVLEQGQELVLEIWLRKQ
jgi:hypothetical protein